MYVKLAAVNWEPASFPKQAIHLSADLVSRWCWFPEEELTTWNEMLPLSLRYSGLAKDHEKQDLVCKFKCHRFEKRSAWGGRREISDLCCVWTITRNSQEAFNFRISFPKERLEQEPESLVFSAMQRNLHGFSKHKINWGSSFVESPAIL